MNLSKEFEVTPTVFVYGGETLARLPDGRAVFIPYAIPGEILSIQLTVEKDHYAKGELKEVLTPSPSRITPRCPHFTHCGGCHYQHIPYHDQLKIKQSILTDQLIRVGKLTDPPVKRIVPSPEAWNYRNHIQFHLSESGRLGFMSRSNHIIPIEECHLPDNKITQIWPALDFELIPGLDRISLRSGEEGADLLILLESSDPQPIEFSVDIPLSAVHKGPSGEIVLAGDEFTVIQVHDYPFVISAGAFFQVNTRVAELLVDCILEKLPLSEEHILLDVYCGVGLFSLFLAPHVKRLIAVESDPSAAEDFLYNLSGFDNVELYDLKAEEVLPNLDLTPNVILLDPPRVGISKPVLDATVKLQPELIVYISCDPATLGRDLSRYHKQGYHLQESIPFDMFPQTYHIESVNFLERV
jgi:23S rRNA (uracil1939-C5)-methyltransferase